jgi:hypothetical protein
MQISCTTGLRRTRPDITSRSGGAQHIRGSPVTKWPMSGLRSQPRNRTTRGVEWLQGGARPMPLPRSLTPQARNLREEMGQWAGGRTSRKKYKMPAKQKPDGTVAGSSKRHASRFCQLKTGHCLAGECLNWTKSRGLLADERCSSAVLECQTLRRASVLANTI